MYIILWSHQTLLIGYWAGLYLLFPNQSNRIASIEDYNDRLFSSRTVKKINCVSGVFCCVSDVFCQRWIDHHHHLWSRSVTQFRDQLSLNRINPRVRQKKKWNGILNIYMGCWTHLYFYWCERHNFSKYDIQNYKLVNDKSRSETDKTLIRADQSLGSVCHNVIAVWISLNISEYFSYPWHTKWWRLIYPRQVVTVRQKRCLFICCLIFWSQLFCSAVRGRAHKQDQQQRQQLHCGHHQGVLARLQVCVHNSSMFIRNKRNKQELGLFHWVHQV